MTEHITRDEVLKVAHLARLKLMPEEVDQFTAQLSNVLEYVSRLDELDTENVEPMAHAVELSNVFREDEISPSIPIAAALLNSPKTDGRYFLVPQIFDAE
ncbi:MAG: Asp-tRNA(Asn)/Glu-tRNA(Gln) amidotransferase subunit GatC [Planctomycetota bacterium]|nr:Asp-tRNA(Asn)/Glu-tRNA(Gln) amidotransferase subunit GatC [Planctomycetota bacterium]MDA1212457.1 Asp-tRNA(Asn)/Glu-tRNA(Gln) amidotransferase subunit GatC [Planctomycetota bacterium]